MSSPNPDQQLNSRPGDLKTLKMYVQVSHATGVLVYTSMHFEDVFDVNCILALRYGSLHAWQPHRK